MKYENFIHLVRQISFLNINVQFIFKNKDFKYEIPSN